MTSTIDELRETCLVEEQRTLPGERGRQSQFRASPSLVNALEEARCEYKVQGLIRLKDTVGSLINYRDADETRRMHRVLGGANLSLASINLELTGPDIVRTRFHLHVDRASYRPVAPVLYRIFNRGSFHMGGRAYGWWQTLPKKRRAQHLINSEPFAEPDFAQLHPSMLYVRRGLRLYLDPYDTGEFPREHGKLAFNIALNARTLPGAISAFVNKTGWPYSAQDTAKLLSLLKRRNAPIADDLHMNQGIRLMRVDSEIILGAARACANEGIPVLRVNDSILTRLPHSGRVAELMEASAARQFNVANPCTVRVSGE